MMVLRVLGPMWIILVPVLPAGDGSRSRRVELADRALTAHTQLGYFQVIAEPVSTWVQEICAWRPRHSPRLVTNYKFRRGHWHRPDTVLHGRVLDVRVSSAMSSTTAACSWFSSRCGALQPSRYET